MKEAIINWLAEIEKRDGVPPEEVVALNFRLFQSELGYMMYLVGAFEYSEEDDDWASLELPTKEYRYLQLDSESENWEEVLESVFGIIYDLEKSGAFKNGLLSNVRAITVGFDDGELKKVR